MCAYQVGRNVSYSEIVGNVLNEWSLAMILVGRFDLVIMDPPWENKSVKRSKK